jgi:hypothetical protein
VESEDITVYGTFFDNGSNVQLEGANGTLYDTTNFVFDNASTIRFRIGTMAAGQDANRPYKIVVTDTANVTTKSTQTLGFPNPTWSSPANESIQEFYTQTSNTLTLSALDSLGGSYVGYSVLSGEIPSGLTFSGNTISGTSTASDGTTNTAIIRATDTLDSSKYADLTLTFEVNGLYPFGSTHTFTTGGQTSYTGPSIQTLQTAYDVPWDTNLNFFNVPSTGIQQWTVPKTGMYEIDAYGATGGYAYLAGTSTIEYGGRGARIRGRFNLNKGEYIRILVGQMGVNNPRNSRGGGGGGGTFVYNLTATTLLIAAGGGGGGGQYARPTSADANHDSINGNAGSHTNPGAGGTNGNGGGVVSYGGGGAGWLGNGTNSSYGNGGTRFLNGGNGGTGYSDGVHGGFGGGGGSYAGGGGGAGYSGGGAGGWSNSGHGGGGGSYIDSSAADPFTELNPIENVDGKVIITVDDD